MPALIAFFTGPLRLYAWLGSLALVAFLVSTIYIKGRADCNASWREYNRKQVERAQSGSRKITEADSTASEADRKKLAELEKELEALEDDATVCLNKSDNEWLRKFWN